MSKHNQRLTLGQFRRATACFADDIPIQVDAYAADSFTGFAGGHIQDIHTSLPDLRDAEADAALIIRVGKSLTKERKQT